MVIRNKCEGFYNHFSSVEDRIESNEIKQLVAEKQSASGLYELCKKFADIGINAPKQKVDKLGNVQGCFQFKDIEAAEQAFMRAHRCQTPLNTDKENKAELKIL